jgi:hypothetical protein
MAVELPGLPQAGGVLAAVNPTPLRGRLRRGLTAAVRATFDALQAGAEKRRSAEQRNAD